MELKESYKEWIVELKQKVKSAQIKAAVSVNKELILFYWDFGENLSHQLEQSNWGDKVLDNVSKDLRNAFPEMKGFSKTNLKYIKRFYEYFSSQNLVDLEIGHQLGVQNQNTDNQVDEKGQQLGDQFKEQTSSERNKEMISAFIVKFVAVIPWRHIIEIITKSHNFNETVFYIQRTQENNWSRNTLALQIKSNLYQRKGKAISNFKNTLPDPLSDLAQESLKDPYIFDFLQLSEDYKEKDVENQLVLHIQKFLLELGKGFAFVGRQHHLEIANKDYYIDLLFYHIKLKCYVVIELKNAEFHPEYAGKINFYLSAVDSLLKNNDDRPTIGILLCREKNNIEAEFALRGMTKPIGVSEFEMTDELPENLKTSLPTVEEIEETLTNNE